MKNNTCEIVHLAESQIEMLKLSDKDIECGNLISHEQVNENNLNWLNDFGSVNEEN